MDFVQDWTADGRPLLMLVVLDEYTRECLAIEVRRRLRGEGRGGGTRRADGDPWRAGAPAGGQRSGDDLEGGEGVVRSERHGCVLHRPGVAVAERDLGELQRPAAGRTALIGDLRHAGGGEAAGGSVGAALQLSADPAGARQADPGGICGGVPGAASAPARSARLRCDTAKHGGAAIMQQLLYGVDR